MSRLSGYYLESTTPTAWNSFTASVTERQDYTVPGAKKGDFVFVAVEIASALELSDITFYAEVSADDTVTVAAIPDSGTGGLISEVPIRIKVVPFGAI